MWAVIKKEFKSYFLSPIGYVVVGILLGAYSIFFWYGTSSPYAMPVVDLSYLYTYAAAWGLAIVAPILTMRMFAEERKNGTEQLILTAPISITKVVLGKLIAALGVIGITLILSLGYYVIISTLKSISIIPVLTAILGFILISTAAISVGMLASSITENQAISAIITTAFLILTLLIDNQMPVISKLSIINFYVKFPSGVISLTEIAGLVSFSMVFICLTILVMQRRKSVK